MLFDFAAVQVLLANDVGDKLTISMGASRNHKHGRGNSLLTLSLLKAREQSGEHFIECFFHHVNRYSHAVKLQRRVVRPIHSLREGERLRPVVHAEVLIHEMTQRILFVQADLN